MMKIVKVSAIIFQHLREVLLTKSEEPPKNSYDLIANDFES